MRWFGAILLAVAAWSIPGVAMPPQQYADGVFERLQRARRQAEVPPLDRDARLDAAARERARTIAGLPHRERLSVDEPVARLLEEQGIRTFRHASLHVDMQRGYTDPPATFFRHWTEHSSWPKPLEARYDSVGLATVQADDGWVILVVVLLEPQRLPTDLSSIEHEAVTRANAERAARDLPPLIEEPWLAKIARSHSQDMARRGFFGHESPEGLQVTDRVRAAGRETSRLGENIYRGKGTAADARSAVDAWMTSPGHRENLLGADYVRTGVGVAVDADGFLYFTQIFSTP